MKKKQVFGLFALAILVGFLIEVFSPELQALGLSARAVHALGGGFQLAACCFSP